MILILCSCSINFKLWQNWKIIHHQKSLEHHPLHTKFTSKKRRQTSEMDNQKTNDERWTLKRRRTKRFMWLYTLSWIYTFIIYIFYTSSSSLSSSFFFFSFLKEITAKTTFDRVFGRNIFLILIKNHDNRTNDQIVRCECEFVYISMNRRRWKSTTPEEETQKTYKNLNKIELKIIIIIIFLKAKLNKPTTATTTKTTNYQKMQTRDNKRTRILMRWVVTVTSQVT